MYSRIDFLRTARNLKTVVYFSSQPQKFMSRYATLYLACRRYREFSRYRRGMGERSREKRERNSADSLLIAYEASNLFLLNIAVNRDR